MIRRAQPFVLMLLLLTAPHPGASQPRPLTPAARSAPAVAASVAPAALPTSDNWWAQRKKRFQELAVCGLSSANVTYLLLTGISGPGAVIGFTVSLLGVIVCL